MAASCPLVLLSFRLGEKTDVESLAVQEPNNYEKSALSPSGVLEAAVSKSIAHMETASDKSFLLCIRRSNDCKAEA